MRILALVNQKGGVGKTTTAINLAASLAAMKRRLLLIDMDPQGNATTGSGVNKHELPKSACDVLLDNVPISEAAILVPQAGYHLIGANGDLTSAQVHLLKSDTREFKLKNALHAVSKDYDYVLIDCPPSLSLLTINALTAAEAVLIPVQCEYFALEGLSDLLYLIEELRKTINPHLRIEGILRTLYDSRNKLTQDVSQELSQHFGDKLYRTIISRNVRLAEAPAHGLSVLQFDKRSVGAAAHLALAGELIRRETETVTSASHHEKEN